MKKAILKVIVFFLSNTVGFYIGPAVFLTVLSLDLVDIDAETFNMAAFNHDLFFKHYMIWMVCAVFSFAFFFLRGKWRYVFLYAPIIIPFINCLVNLQKHF